MRWAILSTVLAACGGSHECTVAATGSTVYFVTSVQLPQSSNDFAFDLNDDGHNDNRMGNILGALIMNRWDPQGAVDAAIKDGSFRPTLEVIEGSDAGTGFAA